MLLVLWPLFVVHQDEHVARKILLCMAVSKCFSSSSSTDLENRSVNRRFVLCIVTERRVWPAVKGLGLNVNAERRWRCANSLCSCFSVPLCMWCIWLLRAKVEMLITSTKKVVCLFRFVGLSVCLSVCEQNYLKSCGWNVWEWLSLG